MCLMLLITGLGSLQDSIWYRLSGSNNLMMHVGGVMLEIVYSVVGSSDGVVVALLSPRTAGIFSMLFSSRGEFTGSIWGIGSGAWGGLSIVRGSAI